jgi:hypothetical protein
MEWYAPWPKRQHTVSTVFVALTQNLTLHVRDCRAAQGDPVTTRPLYVRGLCPVGGMKGGRENRTGMNMSPPMRNSARPAAAAARSARQCGGAIYCGSHGERQAAAEGCKTEPLE